MADTRNAKIRALYLKIMVKCEHRRNGDTVELELTGEEIAIILAALRENSDGTL